MLRRFRRWLAQDPRAVYTTVFVAVVLLAALIYLLVAGTGGPCDDACFT